LKSGGPLLGYNNNIPYKGHVYHVQTEDSGSKRPHVITHLFADGGRVVSTTKTSYADMVGIENMADKVRTLMRDQHKGMVISLRDGEFDHLLDGALPPQLNEGTASDAAAASAETAASAEPFPESTPASVPLELVDKADDGEFVKQVSEIALDPSDDGTRPGSYSYVGSRSSLPSRSSYPPPSSSPATVRRPSATPGTPPVGSPTSARMQSDAPPALDNVSPRRRHRRSKDDPSLRTAPDASPEDAHASRIFGERYTSTRRFDELVLAFLERG
jgi:hypothetical protein